MGAGWFNLGSIVLGIFTLFLPCLMVALHRRLHPFAVSVMSFASLGSCAICLALQLFDYGHLTAIEDWGAMLDTAPTLMRVVTWFLLATLLFNGAALGIFYGAVKERKLPET